jgi:hypothetical protein
MRIEIIMLLYTILYVVIMIAVYLNPTWKILYWVYLICLIGELLWIGLLRLVHIASSQME